MEFILAKLLLPVLLPLLIAAVKVGVQKATPSLYAKIPKQVWMVLIPVLAEGSAQWSPDLFLIPGLPAAASTALYSMGAAGAREFMTQLMKVVQGDTAPAGTLLGPAETPSGI